MYSAAEIVLWLRKWLLDYRFADFSREDHLRGIEHIYVRVQSYIDSDDDMIRLPARSAAHYMAQSNTRLTRSLIITELLSCVLLPCALTGWLVAGLCAPLRNTVRARGVRWNQNRFLYERNPSAYHTPQELSGDAPQTVFADKRYLRFEDVAFIWRVVKAAWPLLSLFRMQWVFKITKEIAWVRPLIDSSPTDYALLDGEFNCAISVLTLYARTHGQHLYDVQHGDMAVTSATSFFEVDRMYCWNQHYIDMMLLTHARADFRIYENPSFILSEAEKNMPRSGVGVFMPDFITLPTQEEKDAFVAALNALSKQCKVSLRPHPAYMHQCMALAPQLSPSIEITDPASESSKQFLLRHEVVVGTLSSALLEGVMLGRPVIFIRNTYLERFSSYHFSFTKPNAHICDMHALVDTALSHLAHNATGQVSHG